MNYFAVALLIIVGYLAVYGLVNRVCTCIEKCAVQKTIRDSAVRGFKKKEEEINNGNVS